MRYREYALHVAPCLRHGMGKRAAFNVENALRASSGWLRNNPNALDWAFHILAPAMVGGYMKGWKGAALGAAGGATYKAVSPYLSRFSAYVGDQSANAMDNMANGLDEYVS